MLIVNEPNEPFANSIQRLLLCHIGHHLLKVVNHPSNNVAELSIDYAYFAHLLFLKL